MGRGFEMFIHLFLHPVVGMGIGEYLASDEELLLQWQGNVDKEQSSTFGNSNSAFGATNQRLVYLNDGGGFKDIEYSHISSIESETEKEVKALAEFDGGSLVAGGIGALFFIIGVNVESGAALVLGIILAAIAMALNMEDVQKIMVITGDEAHSKLEFKTSDDVAAELSRIIRENS